MTRGTQDKYQKECQARRQATDYCENVCLISLHNSCPRHGCNMYVIDSKESGDSWFSCQIVYVLLPATKACITIFLVHIFK